MYVSVGKLPHPPPQPALGVAPEGDWHYIDAWEWTGFRWRRRQVPQSTRSVFGEQGEYFMAREHPSDVLFMWEQMRPPSGIYSSDRATGTEAYAGGDLIHRCYVYEYGVGWKPCAWVGMTR